VRKLREHPPSSSVVMLATVVVTVATHDLAKGVLVGVLLSGFFFAHKVGRVLRVDRSPARRRPHAHLRRGRPGVLRLGRALRQRLRLQGGHRPVRIDVSRAHFWDITAVSALDKVVLKFKREGTEVEVIGLNEASATMVDRFAVHDKPGAVEQLMRGRRPAGAARRFGSRLRECAAPPSTCCAPRCWSCADGRLREQVRSSAAAPASCAQWLQDNRSDHQAAHDPADRPGSRASDVLRAGLERPVPVLILR
jgi:hypothetical protein